MAESWWTKITKGAYVPVRDDIVECKLCGRKVDVLNDGQGALVCCGQPMVKIGEAIERHASGEKSFAYESIDPITKQILEGGGTNG